MTDAGRLDASRGAAATRQAVVSGARSPRQVIDEAFARARQVRAGADGLNAFLWSDQRSATGEADRRFANADAAIADGDLLRRAADCRS